MKFTISKSSDTFGYKDYEAEINILEDLEKLQKDNAIPADNDNWKNPSLIIDFRSKTIEIYDYYRE